MPILYTHTNMQFFSFTASFYSLSWIEIKHVLRSHACPVHQIVQNFIVDIPVGRFQVAYPGKDGTLFTEPGTWIEIEI